MKLKDLQKGEFWIATILFFIVIVTLIFNTSNHNDNGNHFAFIRSKISYSYFYNYFLPNFLKTSSIYFSFLVLNFIAIPAILKQHRTVLYYLLIVLLVAAVGIIMGICKTYINTYEFENYKTLQQAYNRMFFDGFGYALWLVIAISVYCSFKTYLVYLIETRLNGSKERSLIKTDLMVGIAFWLAGLILWVTTNSSDQICMLWSLVLGAAIGIFIYSVYYLLPQKYQHIKFINFFVQILSISLLLVIPMSFIALLSFGANAETIFIVLLFHLPAQLFVTAPLAWFLYKNRLQQNKEITSLKTELGKSDANLNFLKSQINPHFLFNALNTLYGTALQENAERTGEGIQKLGDMMRFMLHENTQDKIALIREVDYLNNYIALQKLRTSQSADIKIETVIEDQFNHEQITPMLLIPFIENAFKHGISLRQPSYIKIVLQTKDNTLFFDVSNSTYAKNDNDPEKLKSGIGLENVKQRLKLLYPEQHELIVRETVNEFFVHLTLQL
ncbi:sensor histidine kinase [Pedobacter montanisoli]|uniref:Histidine kinase n=1 Tax=Pedobacter montanisoli TaxID=2923277 RepID=A0ABS9ZRT5_9SPHI|nr:histidine kinase [Pedobacter montanisoli]MCJ0741304.1 histidine kinase [Pedobacter montanisoli]